MVLAAICPDQVILHVCFVGSHKLFLSPLQFGRLLYRHAVRGATVSKAQPEIGPVRRWFENVLASFLCKKAIYGW